MKKILSIALLLFASIAMYAQTDGISYQAVIIDPNGQEIPGVDVEGNILPHATISIRFTILDENNNEIYQEVQTTNTDQYGMINLLIGQGDIEEFTKIEWDGTFKDLKVEIDFTGSGGSYVDLSRQELLFIPYAYHRNITAAGTLIVDGASTLNSSLTVDGPASLNSSLDVNNSNLTNLTGPLNVDGATDLNSSLTVDGMSNLNDSLNVNLQSPSYFTGKITVDDTATFNGPALFNAPVEFVEITVNGPSHLNGQVTVKTTREDADDTYTNYPLLVEGSKQGIAVKVTGSRDNQNNFLSFWDENGMQGRIEGQTISDLNSSEGFIYDNVNMGMGIGFAAWDIVSAGLEVGIALVDLTATSSSSTACVGLGACVTTPIPSLIIAAGLNLVKKIGDAVAMAANLALAIADQVMYNKMIKGSIGVSFSSGSGDYAEWLPKADPNEVFYPGDIVGVTNGFISRSTSGAQKVMVISTMPIVLGNMPSDEEQHKYEKIAFMGQVPVKVIGKVEPGDYILPNIIGNGFGIAVHPDEMEVADYKKIVGVAWEASGGDQLNMVNIAVGLNTNDVGDYVMLQDEKIRSVESDMNEVKIQLKQLTALLSELLPEFEKANSVNVEQAISLVSATESLSNTDQTAEIVNISEDTYDEITYFTPQGDEYQYYEVPREYIEESIQLARELYLETTGKPLEEHEFWKKMQNEPAYEEEIIQYMKSEIEKTIERQVKQNLKFAQKPIKVVETK